MLLIKSLPLPVLLLLLLWGAAPPPAGAADAFYLRLLDRGTQDLELGLVDDAREKLRIASFGFLDEPVLLAEALIQLGRAHARSGDSAKLTETVMRLAELEDRFGAYSAVDAGLRETFEIALRDGLPKALLDRLPMLEHLAAASNAVPSDAEPLTLKQRTKALERQLEADPEDGDALLALSRIYSAGGKAKPASKLLDRLLSAQPGNVEALCLRADIAVGRRECAPALAGLDRCPPRAASDREDAFVLECLISARGPEAGAAFLEQLPEDRRAAAKVVRAARKLDGGSEAVAAEGADLPLGEMPADEISAAANPIESASPAPAVELAGEIPSGSALEERLGRIRADVRESRFREQLQEALLQAQSLANDYPDSSDAQYLAAEIAYLSADWQMVCDYFDRGGRPGADQPDLLFYLAVAKYELGETADAQTILRSALPRLARNPFVNDYIRKILEAPAS